MPETVNGIAFIALATATIGGAIGMLASRNIVHAAFWLLEVSVAAAGIYYLLDAAFIALVQLLVYAGAVSVLMLFTIMLTLRRREDAIRPLDLSLPAAALAIALCGLLLTVIARGGFTVAEMPPTVPDMLAFGRTLFAVDGWSLPFEIASLILLVALVAAVWWSKEGED